MPRSDRQKRALERFKILTLTQWRKANGVTEAQIGSLGDALGYETYLQRKETEKAALVRQVGK